MNIVHLCDCLPFMQEKPDKFYDLAIVDPPYGLGIDGQREYRMGRKSDRKKDFGTW